MTNPYSSPTEIPLAAPAVVSSKAGRWLLILFVMLLILLNGLFFVAARNSGGWGVIGIVNIFAPIANSIAGLAGLMLCGLARFTQKCQSLKWYVAASLLLPAISYVLLCLSIMTFVDARGC